MVGEGLNPSLVACLAFITASIALTPCGKFPGFLALGREGGHSSQPSLSWEGRVLCVSTLERGVANSCVLTL